tara:strand:- start:3175 stop:3939 length:765 start_codon:yes stop_codon:yes gene_type:complete
MKVVILAGGFGSRLSEYTKLVPKPMVQISKKPILIHIMKHFANYNFKNFYIATGYKKTIINKYFTTISSSKKKLGSKHLLFKNFKSDEYQDWEVNLIDTGLNSMTGGRLKQIEKYINKDQAFFMTYGDGLSNVNLSDLLSFHLKHGRIGTVTAVHPPARFGELKISSYSKVLSFKEKPQTTSSWINGGYFIFDKKFFTYINSNSTILEEKPLEKLSKKNNLMAYKHIGFWQPMDTKRDKDYLEKLYKKNKKKWP